jgi:hypothetical protein
MEEEYVYWLKHILGGKIEFSVHPEKTVTLLPKIMEEVFLKKARKNETQ